ncbi:hypothetical protein VNO77_33904 [Canavalia gladiata]|uniref:Homogentisate phytyltransferase 1, chloroplastic n=1 Tax=Canavalia gladiata TaxID=3824 RepID=A0AAN9KDA9_CANGL
MNLYVVGVNHLSDVEIDKINKPFRPIASGEYSFGTGVIITASSLILSFWHCWIIGSWPLFWTLFVCFMMGTAYSVNMPLLRWKKHPVLAAMSILVMRGLAFQLGFYLHMQTHVYKRPTIFSRSMIFATIFLSFFYIAMSLLKDIPDIEGDKIFGVQSFALLLGQKRVFWISIFLLEIGYGVGILMGATSPYLWSKIITGVGHAFLALVLCYHAKSVDLKNSASTTSFYTFIWKVISNL